MTDEYRDIFDPNLPEDHDGEPAENLPEYKDPFNSTLEDEPEPSPASKPSLLRRALMLFGVGRGKKFVPPVPPMTEEDFVRVYAQVVRDLCDINAKEVVPNGKPAHARELLKIFLDAAQCDVMVRDDEMARVIFGDIDIVRQIAILLRKGIAVSINVLPQARSVLDGVPRSFLDDPVFRASVAPDNVGRFPNFVVVDGKRYRWNEPGKVPVAGTYDADLGKQIRELFQVIESKSEVIRCATS